MDRTSSLALRATTPRSAGCRDQPLCTATSAIPVCSTKHHAASDRPLWRVGRLYAPDGKYVAVGASVYGGGHGAVFVYEFDASSGTYHAMPGGSPAMHASGAVGACGNVVVAISDDGLLVVVQCPNRHVQYATRSNTTDSEPFVQSSSSSSLADPPGLNATATLSGLRGIGVVANRQVAVDWPTRRTHQRLHVRPYHRHVHLRCRSLDWR